MKGIPKLADSKPRVIELLAPARDADTGIAAITHGADAVYIGPDRFGARAAAGNSVEEIARLVDFAHPYRAKVYVTLNTILADADLKSAERLVRDLYRVGVDALIVQDMALLRLDLPPIELHASTQCDTRTPAKARFLEEVGFSQIVLARELTLTQIREICESVSVPVEGFIHGALCVSYSGRCQASQAYCGRSANKGACAQLCRLPYTLYDATGKALSKERHLLSLRDFNASDVLEELLEAGVSSLKIEGRLKNISYVKNVTAYYRRRLDALIASQPDKYCRASAGITSFSFEPDLQKSFNRGFTTYFLQNRRPKHIASLLTPKSLGEPVTPETQLMPGDGLSFFDKADKYEGVRVNKVENGQPIPAPGSRIPRGVQLYRTHDAAHEKLMARSDTAMRKIPIEIDLYANRAEARDAERGCRVVVGYDAQPEAAKSDMNYHDVFEKLGGTRYSLKRFTQHFDTPTFIPRSILTQLRRNLVAALDENARATYPVALRRSENRKFPYPEEELKSSDNVYNSLAETFYRDHGVKEITPAIETLPAKLIPSGTPLMHTRHCVLRELGLCKKEGHRFREPLRLVNPAGASFILHTDCTACEMHLLKP